MTIMSLWNDLVFLQAENCSLFFSFRPSNHSYGHVTKFTALVCATIQLKKVTDRQGVQKTIYCSPSPSSYIHTLYIANAIVLPLTRNKGGTNGCRFSHFSSIQ